MLRLPSARARPLSKADFETKSLVVIIAVCYSSSLLFGWSGTLQPAASFAQLLLFQIGNALAISASVMAGRYTGLRGQHVAASAYILLGITHGISLAALGRSSINAERGMTMVMPMFPALVFMFWCDLYPRWLRIAGIVPVVFFTMVYIYVHRGSPYMSVVLNAGYATLQILEVAWAYYLIRDWRRTSRASRQ